MFHDVLAGGLLLSASDPVQPTSDGKEPFNYVIKSGQHRRRQRLLFRRRKATRSHTNSPTSRPRDGAGQVGGSYTYARETDTTAATRFRHRCRGPRVQYRSFTSRSTDAFVGVPLLVEGGYANNWTVRNFTASPVTLSAVSAEARLQRCLGRHPRSAPFCNRGTKWASNSPGTHSVPRRGPQFTSPNGNKWDVTFYDQRRQPAVARSSCEGDCRVFPNSSVWTTRECCCLIPRAVTINSETPGAADSFDRLIKLVGDNTGGAKRDVGQAVDGDVRQRHLHRGDSQWTSVLTVDNPTDSPQAPPGWKTTTFTHHHDDDAAIRCPTATTRLPCRHRQITSSR